VTGGTGYIGGHVISQLLQKGYTVKAIIRPNRESALRTLFPEGFEKKQIEAIEIASLDSGDYTEALKGVDAVIHVAVPNPAKGAHLSCPSSVHQPTNFRCFVSGWSGQEVFDVCQRKILDCHCLRYCDRECTMAHCISSSLLSARESRTSLSQDP